MNGIVIQKENVPLPADSKKPRLKNKILLTKSKNVSSKPSFRKPKQNSLKKNRKHSRNRRNKSNSAQLRNHYGQLSLGLKKKRKMLLIEKGFKISQSEAKFQSLTSKSKKSKETYLLQTFLKKNRKMMTSLKENHLKIDYLSRKHMLNQCLKEYLKYETEEERQEKTAAGRLHRKLKMNKTARTNLKHLRDPRRKALYRSANPKKVGKWGASNRGLSRNNICKLNSKFENKIPSGFRISKKDRKMRLVLNAKNEAKKSAKKDPIGAHLLDMSPFNIHFKKIHFGISSMGKELQFDNLLALSFQDPKKFKAVDQIEKILKGKHEIGKEKGLKQMLNPVERNLKLKIQINEKRESLKSLKTQNFYSQKHFGKLTGLFGR